MCLQGYEYSFQPPPYEALYHHRHMIQYLSLISRFQGLPCSFPNLRKLTIDLRRAKKDAPEKISLDLTKMTPLLVNLDVTGAKPTSASWLEVLDHPHIKHMRLKDVSVQAVDAPVFWKACGKMEILGIFDLHIEGRGELPTDVTFDRLRELALWMNQGLDATDQLDLILRCPKLECLILSCCDNQPKHIEFPASTRHHIQEKYWPNIDTFFFKCPLPDMEVAFILKNVGNLVCLKGLNDCTLGTQASRDLQPHFNTLVVLNLSSCLSVISTTIRDVLCRCARLKQLRVRTVLAKDIAVDPGRVNDSGCWG